LSLKTKLMQLESHSYYNDYSYGKLGKTFMYQAFYDFMDNNEFHNFLYNNTRTGNFHSKLFQRYIQILEANLPYKYVCNKKEKINTSILDFDIFEGLSTFEGCVKNGIIRNSSTDMFFTRSNSDVLKPFYFGKLVSLLDIGTLQNRITDVSSYTFNKIYMSNAEDKKYSVSYFKIKPHHESGALGHINRILNELRKK